MSLLTINDANVRDDLMYFFQSYGVLEMYGLTISANNVLQPSTNKQRDIDKTKRTTEGIVDENRYKLQPAFARIFDSLYDYVRHSINDEDDEETVRNAFVESEVKCVRSVRISVFEGILFAKIKHKVKEGFDKFMSTSMGLLSTDALWLAQGSSALELLVDTELFKQVCKKLDDMVVGLLTAFFSPSEQADVLFHDTLFETIEGITRRSLSKLIELISKKTSLKCELTLR
jgi:hypothetical protein